MRHKISRAILGILVLTVGVVGLVRDSFEIWIGVVFLLSGISFLYAGFIGGKKD